MAEELPLYALDVSPVSTLQFMLLRDAFGADTTSRCFITLQHLGRSKDHVAFKVKTTQPRRYLVRPNQGVVAPGKSETITVILVEKDKHALLQAFDCIGLSSADHPCTDKFLVQSCAVADEFAARFMHEKRTDEDDGEGKNKIVGKEMGEALTEMWNSVATSRSSVQVYYKKLHVRHFVPLVEAAVLSPDNDAILSLSSLEFVAARSPSPPSIDNSDLENNTTIQQLSFEILSLRRKYGELLALSVSLTAERDILNNTLEQMKRDLNRKTTTTRASLENKSAGRDSRKGRGIHQSKLVVMIGVFIIVVLILVLVSFFLGMKVANSDAVRLFS